MTPDKPHIIQKAKQRHPGQLYLPHEGKVAFRTGRDAEELIKDWYAQYGCPYEGCYEVGVIPEWGKGFNFCAKHGLQNAPLLKKTFPDILTKSTPVSRIREPRETTKRYTVKKTNGHWHLISDSFKQLCSSWENAIESAWLLNT